MGRSGKGTGSYVQKDIFFECFLHEWNIAGSVPCASKCRFTRGSLKNAKVSLLLSEQCDLPLLLEEQWRSVVLSLCLNRIST